MGAYTAGDNTKVAVWAATTAKDKCATVDASATAGLAYCEDVYNNSTNYHCVKC